ncbi:succinate dehydrogenase cytochrome b560 subunit [Amylocarpus encephaloides]|uniref:Succinate dehydrogenase cytochrome b560 subunit n=1 Tax=Amylocarpus encephaloides TaxID=45428 RepID=A0A9P8CA42_9HELO|nr:succinate dehydrogenase cytochrome b560 subunit [Amylocarpus encephaloides]
MVAPQGLRNMLPKPKIAFRALSLTSTGSAWRVNTTAFSPSAFVPYNHGHLILAQQRLRRPVSPHLAIYRMQINYFTSPVHRITGCLVSGTIYAFGATYLVSPLFGWHVDIASIAAAFGDLPIAAKLSAKFAFAWPFVFHCVNGCGHLIWDTGRRFKTKQIVAQGWTIVGLSLAGAGWLAFMV